MARPARIRFAYLAAAALLVPAALAACGGPAPATRSAGRTTTSPAPTSTTTTASTPQVPIDPDPVPVAWATVVREYDAKIRRAGSVRYEFAQRLNHSYLTGSAVAGRAKAGWSSRSTLESGPANRTTVVSVPGKAYIGGLPGLGKNWAVVTRNGTDPLSRQLRPQFDTLQLDADPAAVLRRLPLHTVQLRRPVADHGDSHYEATLTGPEVLPLFGPALRKRLAESATDLSSDVGLYITGTTGMPSSLSIRTTVDGVSLDFELRYQDWGTPVTIKAPPRSRQVRVTKIVLRSQSDVLAV